MEMFLYWFAGGAAAYPGVKAFLWLRKISDENKSEPWFFGFHEEVRMLAGCAIGGFFSLWVYPLLPVFLMMRLIYGRT